MHTQFYLSQQTDPYYNLAVESYLMAQLPPDSCLLYLWQNEKTVVIGKNQNPWQECHVERLISEGGHVARRLSGGGAVYHDLGNLNFTFIVATDQYDVDKQLAVILQAVQRAGIGAEKSGRNDLTIAGKKFSGNAFYHSGGKSYHHGTLLVKVDHEALGRYLNVPSEKLQSKGVSSVRSRVTNLVDYQPDLTIDQLKGYLLAAFGEVYGSQPTEIDQSDWDQAKLQQLVQQFGAWQWRMGQRIPFAFQAKQRYPWGSVDIQLQINAGKINDGQVYSDAMDSQLIAQILPCLRGTIFSSEQMCQQLENLINGDNQLIVRDIQQLLKDNLDGEGQTMIQYDLVVIGAGPGGYVAAIRGAQLGLTVAVVENREIGGTCLNRGCIPTKTLLHTATLYEQLQHCADLGIDVSAVSCNLEQLYKRKDQVTDQLRAGIAGLFKSHGITLYQGQGKIMGDHWVQVVSDQGSTDLQGQSIIIATGGQPAIPPIAGADLPQVVTSDDLLTQQSQLFKHLVIIGGGVIGVEFASIYHNLGCQVTIVEAMDRLLPQMDSEISQNLTMLFKRAGIQVHVGAQVQQISQEVGDDLQVTIEAKGKQQVLSGDGVLIATGRKPNSAGVWCDDVAIETHRGYIVVDDQCRTSVAHIYAIGDVTAGIQLAHRASAQGTALAEYLAGHTSAVDLAVVPSCIYTQPEIASVGVTADEAKAQGRETIIGKFSMLANGKSVIGQEKRGFIKLIFDAQTQVLLGAQLMCGRATDLIGELTTAVVNGLTRDQLAKAVRAHPTFGEAIGEAIDDSGSMGAIHAMARKR